MQPKEPSAPHKGKQILLRRYVKRLLQGLQPIIENLNERYKQWTKPDTDWLIVGTMVDVARIKRDLMAESAFLRQQLIVLGVKHPYSQNMHAIQN